MKKNQPGSALLLLLVLGLAVIALIVFTKGGLWQKLYGPADQAGTGGVKARVEDMKQKVDTHNLEANEAIDPEAVNPDSALDKANDLIDSQDDGAAGSANE